MSRYVCLYSCVCVCVLCLCVKQNTTIKYVLLFVAFCLHIFLPEGNGVCCTQKLHCIHIHACCAFIHYSRRVSKKYTFVTVCVCMCVLTNRIRARFLDKREDKATCKITALIKPLIEPLKSFSENRSSHFMGMHTVQVCRSTQRTHARNYAHTRSDM